MGSAERKYIPEGAENFRAPGNQPIEKKKPVSFSSPDGSGLVKINYDRKVKVGLNISSPDGSGLVVIKHPEPVEEPLPEHTHTEWCEGGHAVAAIKADNRRVLRVSARPGPGYLGITELDGYSRTSAGFHADEPGGSHDAKVILSKGDNLHTAIMEANQVKLKYGRHIAHVARALREGDLNHEQVVRIMDNVDEKEAEKEKLLNSAIIYVKGTDGKLTEHISPIDGANQVELPRSLDIFNSSDKNEYENSLPAWGRYDKLAA